MKKISGVGRRHILRNFFKRINTPYDLRINNAIDGEEMLHLALTKKSLYILISSLLVLSFVLISFIFLFTPIKYYIPGYETNASRKKLVELHAKIEELERLQSGRDQLLENIIAVSTDNEKILLDTVLLDKQALNRANIINALNIATDAGKQRVIGSKPKLDTLKKEEQKKDIKDLADPVEVKIVEQPKKRDTVIIYK